MVKGVAIVTRHVKPRKAGEWPAFEKKKVLLICQMLCQFVLHAKSHVVLIAKLLETGKSARVCNRCKEIF